MWEKTPKRGGKSTLRFKRHREVCKWTKRPTEESVGGRRALKSAAEEAMLLLHAWSLSFSFFISTVNCTTLMSGKLVRTAGLHMRNQMNPHRFKESPCMIFHSHVCVRVRVTAQKDNWDCSYIQNDIVLILLVIYRSYSMSLAGARETAAVPGLYQHHKQIFSL